MLLVGRLSVEELLLAGHLLLLAEQIEQLVDRFALLHALVDALLDEAAAELPLLEQRVVVAALRTARDRVAEVAPAADVLVRCADYLAVQARLVHRRRTTLINLTILVAAAVTVLVAAVV